MISELIGDTCAELRERRGQIPTLRNLLEELGSPGGREAITDKGRSRFFQDLCRLVVNNPDDLYFSDVTNRFRERYPRPGNLTLRTRFYPNRADYRAFYVDDSVERQIAGAILQTTMYPRSYLRPHCSWEEVLPHKNKNVLFLDVVYPKGHACFLVLGDLSGFTATNLNSWVMLVFLALHYEFDISLRHLDRPFVVLINEEPLETTVLEAIHLYLYMVVFAELHEDRSSKPFYTMGGCLGVNANIFLTLLAFTITINRLAEKFPRTVRFYRQLGGDDFAFVLIGPVEDVLEARRILENDINRHSGSIKDFRTFFLSDRPFGVTRIRSQFCKKELSVWKTAESDSTHRLILKTVSGLPFMRQLLNPHPMPAVKEVREFLSSAWDACSKIESSEAFSIMVYLYSHLKPDAFRCDSYVAGLFLTAGCTLDGAPHLSRESRELANNVGPFTDSQGIRYRTSLIEKLTHLLIQQQIMVRDVYCSGCQQMVKCYSAKKERVAWWSITRPWVDLIKPQDSETLAGISSLGDEIKQLVLLISKIDK